MDDVVVDEDGGRRRVEAARLQVLSGCTEAAGRSRQAKRGAWAAQKNTGKKCSVTCRRQLSHIPNLAGLQRLSNIACCRAMASHVKLYRSQVRPIAIRETRTRVRPKSRWCSPRRLCCRSPWVLQEGRREHSGAAWLQVTELQQHKLPS